MSLSEWREAKIVHAQNYSFYALMMAALYQADTINALKIRAAWPELAEEMIQRYQSGGGVLPGEPGYADIKAARAEMFNDLQETEGVRE